MSESKLRNMSIDFSVDIINLVKYLKSQHETAVRVMLVSSCRTAKENNS